MTVTGFYHSVYFWLREGGTAEDGQKTVDACRTYLPDIPGIVQMTVGVPATTSGGPVDNTYAVALLIQFESQAAHDAYDTHPNHQRLLAECGSLWNRVQIYDAVPA